MHFIGITGGVGAGKSAILSYIEQEYLARVMLADEIAHELMEPTGSCYAPLRQLLEGRDVTDKEGRFIAPALAKAMFAEPDLREKINAIVHPAVKEYVKNEAEKERKAGKYEFLILEAALLIEEKYDFICDELWYIYTSEANRRERLKKNRGYSDEKITQIFKSQLTEEEFYRHCKIVIDNNKSVSESCRQVKEAIEQLRGRI